MEQQPAQGVPRRKIATPQAAMARVTATAEQIRELFRKLADEYGWEKEVLDWCLKEEGLGARGIDDFEYAISNEADVAALVQATGVANKFQQTSRVRQAWVALKKARSEAEAVEKRGLDEVDLDGLLPQPELDDIAKRFWLRYKLTWPPEIAPSDMLISRLVKESAKKMLSLREVA